MEIREIKDKNSWNDFVIKNGEYSTFLQSFEWGEFQKNLGRKIWRWGVFENEKLGAVALVIKNKLPFGKSYLYIPRGPVSYNSQLITHNFFKQIISFIKDKSVIFLKVDLVKEFSRHEVGIFASLQQVSSFSPYGECPTGTQFPIKETSSVQPKHTLVLDLEKSEEELLVEMHPKTRYNIGLAERKGVKIRFSNDKKDLDKFLELIKITSERDKFLPHAENYYKKMFASLGDGILQVALAEYEDQVLTANLVMFFGNTATYLHGASSNKHRNLMAPHLLQWEMIKKAKEQGFKNYDFWGIAPEGSEKEKAWTGVTRFKRGFGGQEISYPGTFDIPLNSFWYKLYRIVKKVK